MKKYLINGGNRLHGEISVQGSKNSAVAILIACIITDGEILLTNLPDISDVTNCLKILTYYGCDVQYQDKNTVRIKTGYQENRPLPEELAKTMRASSYLLGALLSRFGSCRLPESGGCNFGKRPIDFHINALKALGAYENTENDTLTAHNGLTAGNIFFPAKTVGGTVNAIIAAAKARGTTVIHNAAREPHIKDLASFLNSCGAEIFGAGSDTVIINGKRKLHGCKYKIDYDMIEAGTYMLAALASNGKICCKNTPVSEMQSFFSVLKKLGAVITAKNNSICVSGKNLRPIETVTAPYPGFPTDLQPQLCTLLGIVKGNSTVKETIFENRFLYAKELLKAGFVYDIDGRLMRITGIQRYRSAEFTATDLRGGAALAIAALNADGKSSLKNVEYIERGYSQFAKKLASVGADIREE